MREIRTYGSEGRVAQLNAPSLPLSRKDQEEAFVLVHVEIQGKYEQDFERRMYEYHALISHRYGKRVVSLAVLTDENGNWRPTEHHYKLWGCELLFKFPVVKLIDYREQWEALEKSDNPFAMVVMVHLKTLETRGKDEDRKYWKLRFIRYMFERGFTKDVIPGIFLFIDWLMKLPFVLEQEFKRELQTVEHSYTMPYITSWERAGIEQGKVIGMQQGIQQGKKEGCLEGKVGTLLTLLHHKFGSVPQVFVEKVNEAELAQINRWTKLVLDAEKIEDVFLNSE
jgi:hypothetical protein